MLEFCRRVEVINHEWPDPLTCIPDMIRYLLTGKPLELRLLYSQKMADKIYQLTSNEEFDIVQIEHSRLALYRESINPNSRSKSVLVFHNIAFDQYDRIYNIEKNSVSRLRTWLFSRQLRYWEPSYAEKFNCCLTVSEADKRILLQANPRLSVDVIPNGTDVKKYKLLEANQNSPVLLFVGSMGYLPCADGAVYFCRQVLPFIRETISDIQVWIVGADPSSDVKQLASESIHVTGFVEDILPYYKQAAVSIVPLRAGGGTRLKILEAMALGRPIVSTSIGCEGLNVVDGQHLLIADNPKEFAEKTIRLLKDNALYQLVVTEARKFVVSGYDWDVIAHRLMSKYSELTQKATLG